MNPAAGRALGGGVSRGLCLVPATGIGGDDTTFSTWMFDASGRGSDDGAAMRSWAW